MHPEHTYHLTPCCPSCGAAMRFVRSIPRIGGLAELQTFECRACGVSITEALNPKSWEWLPYKKPPAQTAPRWDAVGASLPASWRRPKLRDCSMGNSDAVSQGRQRAADEKKAQAAIALMKLRHRIKAPKADENSTLPAAPNSPFDWRIFLEWK
jgi:hypothetical protein